MNKTCIARGSRQVAFTQLPNGLLTDLSLSDAAHRLLTVGMHYPSDKRITRAMLARDTGFSEAKVKRTLRELKAAGYVALSPQCQGSPKGDIVFCDDRRFLADTGVTNKPRRGVTDDPLGGSQMNPVGGQICTPSYLYKDLNTLSNTLSNTEQPLAREESILDPEQPEQPAAEILDDRSKQPSETDRLEDPNPSSLVVEEAKRIGDGRISPPSAPPFEDVFERRRRFNQLEKSGWPNSTSLCHFYFDYPSYWSDVVAGRENKRLIYNPELFAYVKRRQAEWSFNKGSVVPDYKVREYLDSLLLANREAEFSKLLGYVEAMREERDRRAAATYSTAAVALDPNEEYFPWNP